MSSGADFFQYDAYLGFFAEDGPWARQLARRLRADGVQVLTSPAELAAGLASARHILLVSPAGAPPLGEAGLVGLDVPGEGRVLIPLWRRGAGPSPGLAPFPALDVRSFEALERAYPTLLRTLHPAGEPAPSYANLDHRRLGEELEAAQVQLDRLRASGADLLAIRHEEARALQLKRELRDRGDLVEGYILSGRFRLLDALGAGGFATVWRAWDRGSRRLVALKVLHPQHLRGGDRVERFFRGAQEMAALDHPFIARVHEPRLSDGAHQYYVMELVDGSDLEADILEGRLSRAEILRILGQVGAALHHAHDRGVAHRDVKPANILLTRDRDARLADFDLALAGGRGGEITTSELGTFVFAAPERCAPEGEVDVRRDVYGLGMTAVFALYGAHLPTAMLFEREAFIAELELPEAAREALGRAIHLDPRRRFGNVAAFVGSLFAAFGV